MPQPKKVLFIDRDGTLIVEPPVDYQVDSLEKLRFVPGAITAMSRIATLGYELVMATNQDGLGTASFPEETFHPAHNLMLATLAGEGIRFDEQLIDRSMPADNAPTRKPRTGMFGRYLDNPQYDLKASYVIGDRVTDIELAKNLGARGILLRPAEEGRRMLAEAGLEQDMAAVARRGTHCSDQPQNPRNRHFGTARPGRRRAFAYRYRAQILRPHARPNRTPRRLHARGNGTG